ncbi:MAG: hypothetical protein ABFS43_12995 [Thermodesulfobacteriota bacterium]
MGPPNILAVLDSLNLIGCAVAAVQTLGPGIYVAMNGRVFPHDRVRKNVRLSHFEEIK